MKKVKITFSGLMAVYVVMATAVLLLWPIRSTYAGISFAGYAALMLLAVFFNTTIDWSQYYLAVIRRKKCFHSIVFVCFGLLGIINMILKPLLVPDTLTANCVMILWNFGLCVLIFIATEYWCEPKDWRFYTIKGMFGDEP